MRIFKAGILTQFQTKVKKKVPDTFNFPAENAEKRVKSTDFDCKFCGFVGYLVFVL